MYASHVLATLFPPWFCRSLGGLCFGWFQCLWWEIGNLSTVQEPGHGSQNGNIYQNVQTPIRLEVQMWDISYISIYLHPFSKFQRLAPHVLVFLLVWCISLSLQKGTLLNCFHLKVHAFCKDLDGGDIIIYRPLKRIHRAIIQTKYEIIRNQGLKMDQVPFEVRPQKLPISC